MFKYLLLGLIITIVYRFWNNNPKIDKTGKEKEEYSDYEEIE